MNRALKIITGIGAGVAAAYFLDPKKGADRRAMLKDKFNSFKNDPQGTISEMTEGIREQAKSYTNDAKGLISEGNRQTDSNRQADVNRPNQPFQTTH